MGDENFSFSFEMPDADRRALLTEAAELIDLDAAHLGSGGARRGPTRDGGGLGDDVRDALDEDARLAASPDVYKITEQDYLARSLAVPVRFADLTRDFDFYWVRFPVGLQPRHHWSFNMIEVRIEFNADEAAGHLRPKAWQILPNKKFHTMLKADQHLELRLDENFEFAAQSGELSGRAGKIDIGVESVANAGAGVVLGPFNYQIKRAQIEHNAPGMEWVFWRLDGAEFFQEDSPELVVIAQVPKATKTVKINAVLQAYRSFNLWSASLQRVIGNLPQMFRNYFKGGAPLRDEKVWDISTRL